MMLKCFSFNLAEDIASEMHNMNVSAKILNEIQRNFNNDPVSDILCIVLFLLGRMSSLS